MRFTDLQPWGLKVSKGTKETFSKLKISIRSAYVTLKVFQLIRIIANFEEKSFSRQIVQYCEEMLKSRIRIYALWVIYYKNTRNFVKYCVETLFFW